MTGFKVELRFNMANCSVAINLSPKNNCRKGEERREVQSTDSAIEISPELHFELKFRNIWTPEALISTSSFSGISVNAPHYSQSTVLSWSSS